MCMRGVPHKLEFFLRFLVFQIIKALFFRSMYGVRFFFWGGGGSLAFLSIFG